ncbi:PqqD family protein [Hathewaya histolytica]|uniref:PqqD family protein n=1 Tax=Hathewaya histolytica TaxID=1498 RepID=UPI003B66B29E
MKRGNNIKRNDNFLLYVPHIKHKEWELRKGNIVLFFRHDKFIEKVISWLFNKPTVTDIKLDKISSQVWLLIDDNKNILEIAQKIRENTKDNLEISSKRLILFLRYLCSKGWIYFTK